MAQYEAPYYGQPPNEAYGWGDPNQSAYVPEQNSFGMDFQSFEYDQNRTTNPDLFKKEEPYAGNMLRPGPPPPVYTNTEMDNSSRPPFKDIQGLLNFALRGSAAEDPGQPSPAALDPERRQWLEEALRNLSVDMVEELGKSLQILTSEGISDPTENPDAYEKALDNLLQMVESIDLANDFHKIGGYTIFLPCLNSVHPGVRSRVGELIGTLCQNNPYCQEKAIEAGLVPILLEKIESDEDETARVKSLYALGSIARDYPDAHKLLIEFDGFSVLLRTLQSKSEKLRTKAAFLLTSLCRSNLDFTDTVCKMGFVEQIVGLLYTDHDSTHEHLLSALLSLARDHSPSRDECTRSALGLEKILAEKIQSCKGDESRMEEAEYCTELMDLCFTGEPVEDR